jgi:hypothetical protein
MQQCEIERKRYGIPEEISIIKSEVWLFFCMEFGVSIIFSPPFVTDYLGDKSHLLDHLNLLVLVRIMPPVIRWMRDRSIIYRSRRDLLNEADKTDVSLSHSTFNFWFTMQYYKQTTSLSFVSGTILVIMLEMGYWMHVTERLHNAEFHQFEDALWFTFITMTTVGYGDMNPTAPLGKFCAAVGGICGILVVSLLIAVVIDLLVLTEDQLWAVNWVTTQRSLNVERDRACEYLQSCWHYYAYVKDWEVRKLEARGSEVKLKKLDLEKKTKSNKHYTGVVEGMKNLRFARQSRRNQQGSSNSDIEIYHKELEQLRAKVVTLENGLDALLTLMDSKGIPQAP